MAAGSVVAVGLLGCEDPLNRLIGIGLSVYGREQHRSAVQVEGHFHAVTIGDSNRAGGSVLGVVSE